MRPLHHVALTAVLLGLFIASGDASAQSVCVCADGTVKYQPIGMPGFGNPPRCPSTLCGGGSSFSQGQIFPSTAPFGADTSGPGVNPNIDIDGQLNIIRQGNADRRAREQHKVSMELQKQQLLLLKQQNEILERQRQELLILQHQQNRQAVPTIAGTLEDTNIAGQDDARYNLGVIY